MVLTKTPGVISLLAGSPNAAVFPFKSLTFTTPQSLIDPSDPNLESLFRIDGADLTEALQYTETPGLKQLLAWISGLQTFCHGRNVNEGWRVSVGIGSRDLLYKAAVAVLNTGDSVFVEAPAYSGATAIFESLGCTQIEVLTDDQGIIPESLSSILDGWPEGKPKPEAIYTMPSGGNPSGTTQNERKLQILQLARKHDFLIFEDDPFYYLYYGATRQPRSYFSLERELPEVGRVLRFDSLSKILSAGLRIGFVTGPTALLAAIDGYTATSNLQTSSFTQAITYKLLNHWGYEGFLSHTEKVSLSYKERSDNFEQAMTKHFGGSAEWIRPVSGVYFWFKLLANKIELRTVTKLKAYQDGLSELPGIDLSFLNGEASRIRVGFGLLSNEEVDKVLNSIKETLISDLASVSHSVQAVNFC
ncbi:pyridoxal phosphate-dependent transferase [Crepidotus variabilis]|uniref:Pyridoxal phosphate-dependent transferase n=1 Tax=Crepidotus variabilis TaxID=179855 RepID=A0A9P6EQ36_9AGAR|nr:pyridoxal phosphate-dependent transferase [Crepidotus variabilis]